LRLQERITEAEYDAGCQWRGIYKNWMRSIGAPSPFAAAIDYRTSDMVQDETNSDSEFDPEQAEAADRIFREGEKTLKRLGRRVFDAVNAIAVYEDADSLGSSEATIRDAKRGLSELAFFFGHARRSAKKVGKEVPTVVGGKKYVSRTSYPSALTSQPDIGKRKTVVTHLFTPRMRAYPDEPKFEWIYLNSCLDLL
jgi:hypothetical protein